MNDTPLPPNAVSGITRAGLATAGGAALVGGSNELIQLLGAVATILTVCWSIWEKSQAARQRPPGPPPAVAALLVGMACAGLLLSGCQTPPTWPDAARKSIHSSVLVCDEFLRYEHAHRATLSPEITAAADAIRRQMPPLVRAARASLDAFEATGKEADRQAASDSLTALTALSEYAAQTLERSP